MNKETTIDNTVMIFCDCEYEGYITVEGRASEFSVKCPECNKKIYNVFCKNCEVGYALPESQIENSLWTCADCGKKYSISSLPHIKPSSHTKYSNIKENYPENYAPTQKRIKFSACLFFLLFLIALIACKFINS